MDALASELRALLGPAGVISEPTRLLPYESDALAMLAVRAELVCLPRDTRETVAAMRLLASHGVPVVPRGAGTGLAGGATPVAGGVVLSTARMRDVLELDVADRFARVQAGVVNVDLTALCKHAHLAYAPDPSSQMACTIGGNVANNQADRTASSTARRRHARTRNRPRRRDGARPAGPELEPAGYDLISPSSAAGTSGSRPRSPCSSCPCRR
jgi:hypothetical protein